MRITLLRAVASALLVCAAVPVLAQDPILDPPVEDAGAQPLALIQGPEDTMAGRTIILDASASRVGAGDVRYEWYLDKQAEPFSRSVDAIYTPERDGTLTFRLVVRVMQNRKLLHSEAVHTVIVYRRKVVLVADPGVPGEKIALHERTASGAGVYLRVLRPRVAVAVRGGEEALAAVFAEHAAAFLGADAIVLWTDGVLALQSLLEAAQGPARSLLNLNSRTVMVVTDGGISTLARTAAGMKAVLRPRQILLAHPAAMTPLLTTPTIDAFLGKAAQQNLEVAVLTDARVRVRPWNVLSALVTYMLTHGVSSQTVILLLMLPVIATILSFLKQVIGITTFGLFAPSIVALSFLALGWWVGLIFLILIVSTGYATRAAMRRWHLLYVPKVAIILIVSSIILLILLALGSSLGLLLARDTVFILLIMSTLSESFLTAKTEQGWLSAVLGIAQTVGAALLCVFVVQWPSFQSMLLAYPELILITIVINIILGRFTGLRLVEYFRFREVFRHLGSEE
ncbi:MAG: hypothetical protein Greene041619_652 [Candidatus Peregrinibacteria bacterium Greene0416_19]|nr:MAG: hypothetical protein Greene041619_652 [Candidatus Peregrinibacteria bacterium Greene0416_19]